MPPEPTPPQPPSFRGKKTYLPPRLRQAIDRREQNNAQSNPLDPFHPAPDPTFQLPRESDAYQTPAGEPQTVSPQPVTTPSAQPVPVESAASPYDFMMNQSKPADNRLTPLVNASLPLRLLAGIGVLFIVVILIIVIKNGLGGTNFAPFTPVLQDQQEIIHIVTAAQKQQQSLSTASLNFAATTQAAVTSSQQSLNTYLKNNHQKITTKTLSLKVSTSVDSQLQNALAASTYDQTFQQVMQTQLTTYVNDLTAAYNQTSGKNGHALLKNDYAQAKLLTTQLSQPGQ